MLVTFGHSARSPVASSPAAPTPNLQLYPPPRRRGFPQACPGQLAASPPRLSARGAPPPGAPRPERWADNSPLPIPAYLPEGPHRRVQPDQKGGPVCQVLRWVAGHLGDVHPRRGQNAARVALQREKGPVRGLRQLRAAGLAPLLCRGGHLRTGTIIPRVKA
eukprot:1189639-Prorocentrum_minimum.AAC.3